MHETLDEHYGYLSDHVKLERYQAAIEQAVRPGHVVMDLGCGGGVLGLMALRAGASKVYFVDESKIVEIARRTIAEAGFTDQAHFFRASSYELAIPERVDIVICDHVGYFGFDYNILSVLEDARRRFLKPDGCTIPAGFDLKLAPAETDEGRNLVDRWRDGSVPDDFASVSTIAANAKLGLCLVAENVLAEPAELQAFELGAPADSFFSWELEIECSRAGRLDGLLSWFDCQLYAGVRMANSPVDDDRILRPQAFLPLETPVVVQEGEAVRAQVMARPADHVLAWTVEFPRLRERQSLTTFNGLLLDDLSISRHREDRTAKLNDRGQAHQIILSYCDGHRTIAEVEAIVKQQHPDLFPSARAAEMFVRRVLARDTSG